MTTGFRTLGKPFTTFLVAETVSAAGTMVAVVALPLIAIEQLQASAFVVGLLEALQWLPAAILGLLLGALVDRSQQRCRMILVTANFGRVASLSAVPVAAQLELLTLPVLLALAFTTGVFTAMSQSAFTPYLRQVVPSNDYASATGSMQAGRSAARVVGPAVGGLLVALIGASNTLFITAGCFLICAVALLTIVGQAAPPPPPRRRLTIEIGEGLGALRSSRILMWITMGAATANLLLSASGALDILYLSRDLGVASDTIGFVLTAGGVGGLTAALVSGRLISRYGLGKVATFAFVFTAPSSLLLPATQSGSSVALFAVGVFTVSFGIALGGVALMTLRLHFTPPHLQARVSSVSQVLNAATIPVGAVLGGAMAELLGTRSALVVLAVGYIAFAIVFVCSPIRTVVPVPNPGQVENPTSSATTGTD
ncbi:MFS transporter [Microbacterium sp. As-52]|uniref:MFS transporter n=1 Tax=Microbacterium sp. As-52 TaxID=3390503 RepID=UPI003CF67BCD